VSEAVDPDRVKTCRERSVNIAVEAVAEHHRLLVRLCQTGQRVAEDLRVRLSGTEFSRHDDSVENGRSPERSSFSC